MDQTFEKRKKVIYDFMKDDLYVPMKIREMAVVLQIPREQRDELKAVLDSLVDEGKITLSKRGKYSVGCAKREKGIFQANARGFGFVTPEDGGEDIFIPEDNINGAFHGDEVEFIITGTPGGRRREGKIVRILSHTVTKIVGLYEIRPPGQSAVYQGYLYSCGKRKGRHERAQGRCGADFLRRRADEAGGKSSGDHRTYQ